MVEVLRGPRDVSPNADYTDAALAASLPRGVGDEKAELKAADTPAAGRVERWAVRFSDERDNSFVGYAYETKLEARKASVHGTLETELVRLVELREGEVVVSQDAYDLGLAYRDEAIAARNAASVPALFTARDEKAENEIRAARAVAVKQCLWAEVDDRVYEAACCGGTYHLESCCDLPEFCATCGGEIVTDAALRTARALGGSEAGE